MSERSERIDVTVHFAHWCTPITDERYLEAVHR